MHSKNYISQARQEAVNVAQNSMLTHRHGCVAVCVRGKNKGTVMASGFNYSSLYTSSQRGRGYQLKVAHLFPTRGKWRREAG